jgi:tRNA wybutosine-synthesizing protein 2
LNSKELELLPRGFQLLGHVAILHLRPEIREKELVIAGAILKLFPQIKSVWTRHGEIEGKYREPMGLFHLVGDPTTEVIISENNVRYKFDFTKIMFAKGNTAERGRVALKIQPGEIIIDMFAGIGYFTLGMAKSRKPRQVYAIEWNPVSFAYLKENLKLNHIEDLVTPILGDCCEEVPKLVSNGIVADRIVMGLLPSPKDAIPAALRAVKSTGTTILYEGVEPKNATELWDEFNEIVSKQHFQCELLERRIVKSYAPGRYHVVIEVKVTQ